MSELEKFKLSVVIVSYNSTETILNTIKPLYQLYKQGYLKVVVIDNHCNDGVQELLHAECKWVIVKAMEENLGFGYGCNAGFSLIHSEYTLFLNPDATICGDSIQKLVTFLDEFPNIAMTGPAIKEGNQLQKAGYMPLPIFGKKSFINDFSEVREIKPNHKPFRTTWLCGAVLMVRSDIFQNLGGFDDKFFMYYEETDLCMRMSNAGYELWTNGMAIAKHIGGVSAKITNKALVDGCIAEHYYKSRYYFFKKNFGMANAILHDFIDLVEIILNSLKLLVYGRKNAFDLLLIRFKSPFFTEPQ